MQTCRKCGVKKDLDEFYKRGEDKSRKNCKVCHRKTSNATRQRLKEKDPEALRTYARKRSLRVLYGLTPEDYEVMLQAQDGRCAVCGATDVGSRNQRYFHVDHCHTTGKIRGLLCGTCNRAAGTLKDDPRRVMALAAYLLSHEDPFMSVSQGG